MNWKDAKRYMQRHEDGELTPEGYDELLNFLYTQHEEAGQFLNTGCPCGTCVPSVMIGMSWWKRLGFNSPTDCAEALREEGHRHFNDWYRGDLK